MTERPILFSGAMVRAILSGQKTQTRRVVKPSPDLIHCGIPFINGHGQGGPGTKDRFIRCPYGKPGDRLWVRECFADEAGGTRKFAGEHIYYRADGDGVDLQGGRWTPSIHMPRWACRIVLEIVSVRVERLQGISLIDAEAEGIVKRRSDVYAGDVDYLPIQDGEPFRTPIEAYRALWESINGAESWLANPWVWVVEFKRVTP